MKGSGVGGGCGLGAAPGRDGGGGRVASWPGLPVAAAGLLLAASPGPVRAQVAPGEEPRLDTGRHLALYPAFYVRLGLTTSLNERTFTDTGERVRAEAPQYGPGRVTARRTELDLRWSFPFFATSGIPLVSDRLWTARVRLGASRLDHTGALAEAARNQRDGRADESGFSDIEAEVGPYLFGAPDWRRETPSRFNLLWTLGTRIPTGRRYATSPVNEGAGNAYAFHTRLGAYARPLPWLTAEAGVQGRTWRRNDEPAFQAQEPSKPGNSLEWDASLAVRPLRGVFLEAGGYGFKRQANTYRDVRGSARPPPSMAGMDTFPEPGERQDGGVSETRVFAGATWFFAPRFALSARYSRAVAGRSGTFDLPYQRQPDDCGALAPLVPCTPQPAGSDRVDGLGLGRARADDRVTLQLSWQQRQGDFWTGGGP